MTATTERSILASRLAAALSTLNHAELTDICTPDVSWSVPGNSPAAGEHHGIDAILALQTIFRDHAVQAEVRHIMHGQDSMVAVLHETGDSRGKHLDVHIALVLTLSGGKISQLTGNISNVAQFSDYLT